MKDRIEKVNRNNHFLPGEGITYMMAPTSGMLIVVLGMAGIPYSSWLKWVMPIQIILVIIGLLLLILTVTMKLNGFYRNLKQMEVILCFFF
jgi:uncharacterized ion transporter superfamily protein YfcC